AEIEQGRCVVDPPAASHQNQDCERVHPVRDADPDGMDRRTPGWRRGRKRRIDRARVHHAARHGTVETACRTSPERASWTNAATATPFAACAGVRSKVRSTEAPSRFSG